MAERKAKPKPAAGDSGVLASLPTTRPSRIGGRRRETTAATTTEEAVKAGPRRKPAATKKRAARKTAAKPKPVAEPVAITDAAAKPKPVRSGAKGLDTAQKKRTPAPPKPPSGTELVTTVVQAAGELAQVGLSIGGQVLKRAIERLPKP